MATLCSIRIVQQVVDVLRNPLRHGRFAVVVQHGGNRPFRHQQFRDVVVDGEHAFDHAFAVAQVNRAGFQHPPVARLGEVTKLVDQRCVALSLNRFQYDAGGAAARLPVGYLPVFDHRDRMLGVVAGDVVHNDFAALAKFHGDCLGKPLQEFQIHIENPLP